MGRTMYERDLTFYARVGYERRRTQGVGQFDAEQAAADDQWQRARTIANAFRVAAIAQSKNRRRGRIPVRVFELRVTTGFTARREN